jgi:hypothetical protein
MTGCRNAQLFEKVGKSWLGQTRVGTKKSPVERDTHIAASGWDNQIAEATAQNTEGPVLATPRDNAA